MRPAHLWDFKYLHGTKAVVLTLVMLALAGLTANAQKTERKKTINLPHFDDRRVHFGFYLATNYSTYRIKRSDFMANNPDSIKSVNPVGTPGFTLGFIFSLKLGDYVDLRFVPGVAFYERWLDYEFGKAGKVRQSMESTMVEFPILFKFKSERRGNNRMYFLLGGKYSMASGLRRKDKKPDELRAINSDLSVEYGFGLDIYNEYFKLSPEIRFSHGLGKAFVDDPNKYAVALKNMTTHTVTISFHFQ
jgi:hypothetical protein